ncbi:MAG: exo-alpha-sialidase [Anaerolineae bacterium]
MFALVIGFAVTFFITVMAAHGAPLLDAPWGPNVKVNDDTPGVADQDTPALAASKVTSDVFTVWLDWRNGDADVHFARSADGGMTWGVSVRVNYDVGGFSQSAPDIAVNAAGVLHVVWSDSRTGDEDVYYSRSTDDGQTWSTEIRVSDFYTGSQNSPAIAALGDAVCIVWADGRVAYNRDVYVDCSADGGLTWGTDTRINDDVGTFSHYGPDIALGTGALPHVVWYDNRNANWDIYYTHLSVAGGWAANVRLNDVSTGSQYHPALAADGDTLHALWTDLGSGSAYVTGDMSLDGGITWGDDWQVSTTDQAENPDVVIDGQGTAWATWKVYSDTTYRLYADSYGINGWSTDDMLITETVDYLYVPAMAAGAARVYVAWQQFLPDEDYDILLSIWDGVAWSDAIQINDEGDARQAYPAIGIGSTGSLYAVWADYRYDTYDGALYADHSLDSGATWNRDVRVDDNHPVGEPPALGAAGVYTVHVAWGAPMANLDASDFTRPEQGYGSIFYDRSGDGALTWGVDRELTDPETNDASSPDLVAAGQLVYVVWRQYDGLYFTSSTDGGTTWISPTQILTSTGSIANPTIARDAAGTLHLAWEEYLYITASEYHIGYARSSDGGVTWTNRQFVDGGAAGTQRDNPDIAVNPANDYVHLVWDDDRTGARTIFHAVSSDGGVTWGTPAAILAGPAVEPSIAVDSDGVAYVLWQDGLEGDTDVAYSMSGNDGGSWSVPGRVNDDATAYPQRQPAVVAGDSAYAVWTDFRRANWDIESAGLQEVCPLPLESVSISGPSETETGVPVDLEAVITPPEATPPLTFVWTPAPAAGQGTAKATYYWQEPDTYTVEVVVSNCGGTVTATHRVSVFRPVPPLPCVEGRVTYATTALSGVQVELISGSSASGPVEQSTTTDASGIYRFCDVAPGAYMLKRYGLTTEYVDWVAGSLTMGGSNVIKHLDLPKKMTLLTPSDGALIHTTIPTMTWQALPEADRYTYQLNKTADWTLVEHTNNIVGTAHQVLAPLEWNTGYTWQIDAYAGTHWVGTTSDNFTFSTSPMIVIELPPIVTIGSSLRLEEAQEGVVVNKLIGDNTGKTAYNYVDVVAYVSTYASEAASNVDVILTVPGNALGTPVNTWVRSTYGGGLMAATSTSLGGGEYKVTTSLTKGCYWWFCPYRKQVVWRFRIPNTITPQTLNLQSRVQRPGYLVFGSFSDADLRLVDTAGALIVTNRTQLYDNHANWEATSLLAQLYNVAQGAPHNDQPLGVVYNADLYDTDVRDWDNTAVNYTSETTANAVANELDDLIEDWVEDGTWTWSYHFFFSTTVSTDFHPYYLLLVGDDDVLPFYRYDDPSNDEGIDKISPWCDHGWCTDSATNPAIHATDEDYFFTDNPYGDLWGGTDWRTGDLELGVGRLVGDTADDMRTLLESSLATDGSTGRAVMASVDGWELGYSNPGCPGDAIGDALNVPARLSARGFNVLNDTETPRTVDVLSGYPADWNSSFRAAANAGMDIFFIGGHNHYSYAGIPGDDFSPDDTCSGATCDYNRFDNDHPLAFIVGCHGGLPVPDIDVPGGVDDDMVYDLVHEGARAYVGATGFSYGSPGSLCYATWGERLLQHFFDEFLPAGSQSRTIGHALSRAKDTYVFGFGSDNGLDRKTVTEFNLYGVPWQRLDYPGGMQQSAVSGQLSAIGGGRPAVSVDAGNVVQADTYRYTRTITVDIAGYDVTQVVTGGVTYDILSIAGGEMALAPDVPVLPYVKGYTLTLPLSATVQSVTLVDSSCGNDTLHEVPIIIAQPWTEGGTAYTTTTDIDTYYPAAENVVVTQTQGDRMLFTLFPIQHNPTNNQTRSCSQMVIEVVYDAPVALAVSDVTPLAETLIPGMPVSVTALLENVTDELLTVTSTLTLLNAEGHEVGWQDGGPFSVPVDGQQSVELGWDGTLPEDVYGLLLTFWKDDVLMGLGTTMVDITGGALTALEVPTATLAMSDTATFRVTFSNYLAEPVTVTAHLALYDNEGGVVATLPAQTDMTAANDTRVFEFTWEVGASVGGVHVAQARIVREDETQYGPLTGEFVVGTALESVLLPVVLRNF